MYSLYPRSITMHHRSKTVTGMTVKDKGFTLLELLVVVVIIGVLAAIALPMYRGYVDKAKRTVAIATMDAIRKTIEGFHIDHAEYPKKPLNFTTWQDASSRVVFPDSLISQINADITPVSYNSATSTYTFVAKAKDAGQTLMTLTQNDLTY